MKFYPRNEREKEILENKVHLFRNNTLTPYQQAYLTKYQLIDFTDMPRPTFPDFLDDYQIDAIKYFRKVNGHVLFHVDTGLGKTVITIAIGHLYNLNMSIICPSFLIPQWEEMFDEFSKYFDNKIKYSISSYTKPKLVYPELLVCDEAHAIKSRFAKLTPRAEKIKNLCYKKCDHYIFMTATPNPNTINELYLPMKILNPYFYGSYKEFRECMRDKHIEYLQPYYYRVKKEDVQKLPEKRNIIRYLPKPGSYDKIVGDHQFELKAKRITYLSNEKIPYVLEEIKKHPDRNILVVSHRKSTLKKLSKILGAPYVIGSMPRERRNEVIKSDWRILLLSFNLGFGLNLQKASVIILVEPDYTEDYKKQVEARSHRRGQKLDVIIVTLIFRDTIEEHIIKHAQNKQDGKELDTYDSNTFEGIMRTYFKSLRRSKCKLL